MKRTHSTATIALIATLFLGLFAVRASAAADYFLKIEGNGVTQKTTADKSGAFSFAGLDAGKYVLTATASPAAAETISLNFSHLKAELGEVIVSSSTKGASATVEVTIAKKGGKVSGVIVAVGKHVGDGK